MQLSFKCPCVSNKFDVSLYNIVGFIIEVYSQKLTKFLKICPPNFENINTNNV